MAFVQTTFMGASIRNFNATVGWSNQPSQLSVALVEDSVNGDVFTPSNIGYPVSFNYEGWIFNGLLQSWKRDDNSGGSPLYDVTVVDPREILEGVPLILSDYGGSTYGVYNLFNVYGYLESFGYGNSDVNESGMSWRKIRDAVQTLSLSTLAGSGNTYGGSIRFMDSNYVVDLSQLPNLPDYYRIGGQNISLMDFIVDVCEAGGCDFFVRMVQNADLSFTIAISVVDRRSVQVLGQIGNFIASATGVSSKNYGYELLQNATSKFVLGGNVEQIYYQYSEAGVANDYTDDTIWPFWGLDAFGNAIIGTGQYDNPYYGNDHQFTLDARAVNVVGVGAYYTTSVGEMRAVLDSIDSWLFYLMLQNQIPGSPQFGRYTSLGCASTINQLLAQILGGVTTIAQLKQIAPSRLSMATGRKQSQNARAYIPDSNMENISRLYDYLRSYAGEYYGRKFMVTTPFIYTKVEPETYKITLSQEPNDSGFLEESAWQDAININLLPFDIDRLTTEEGKIEAYVRFDNAVYLDVSQINPDDYVVSVDGYYVFIKCRVLPGVVYLDKETQYSPRAVIELPGSVRKIGNFGQQASFCAGLIKFLDWLFKLPANVAAGNFGIQSGYTQADIDAAGQEVMAWWLRSGATDMLFQGQLGISLLPNLVALPLRSNVDMYGPWYGSGASGKLEFEHDDSLVPWNYAGYEVMNLAANAKITEALIQQQISEAGTIEFAGVPAVQLGSQLISNGPYVTDIRVNIADNGATTTYNMQLSPRFGRFAKANAERLTRLAKTAQRFRRSFRQLSKLADPSSPIFTSREKSRVSSLPAIVKSTSSHLTLMGDCADGGTVGSGTAAYTKYHITTCSQPNYHLLGQMYDNYEKKGIMSLDGLFVPFSTWTGTASTSASGLPHYRDVDLFSTDVIRDDIDPFVENHGISFIARDDEIPEDGLHEDDGYSDGNDYRGLALRGPITIAGWGYDTNGDPVPLAPSGTTSNPSGNTVALLDNVRQRPDQWRVGPLYTEWDGDRGMWIAGGSSSAGGSLLRATANQAINPYSSGLCTLLSTSASVLGETWLGQPICSGQRMFLSRDNGHYYVVNSEFSSRSVITGLTCVSGVQTVTRTVIYFPSAYASG